MFLFLISFTFSKGQTNTTRLDSIKNELAVQYEHIAQRQTDSRDLKIGSLACAGLGTVLITTGLLSTDNYINNQGMIVAGSICMGLSGAFWIVSEFLPLTPKAFRKAGILIKLQ